MVIITKWLLSISLFCIPLTAVQLQQPSLTLSKERIATAKAHLAHELRVNTSLRYSLLASGAGVAAFLLYKTVNNWYVRTCDAVVYQGEYPALGSWQWAERLARITRDALISAALSKGFIFSGETMLDHVFHARDIHWFLQKHTHLDATLKELKQFSTMLDFPHDYSNAEILYAQEALQITMMSLVVQLEKIVAFMEYKIDRIHLHAMMRPYIEHVPGHITELFDALAQQYALKESNPDCALTEQVMHFSTELILLFTRFIHLEEDISWINEELAAKEKTKNLLKDFHVGLSNNTTKS